MEVIVEDGYVKVIRTKDRECICAGLKIGQGRVTQTPKDQTGYEGANHGRLEIERVDYCLNGQNRTNLFFERERKHGTAKVTLRRGHPFT